MPERFIKVAEEGCGRREKHERLQVQRMVVVGWGEGGCGGGGGGSGTQARVARKVGSRLDRGGGGGHRSSQVD